MSDELSRKSLTLLAVAFVIPAAHPLLIPGVGVASHLLWWIHVLPVSFYTFRFGRRGALATVAISALLVIAGERTFGGGYGVPAPWQTTLSLAAALAFTNVLVAGFAFYARTLTIRFQVLFDRVTVGLLQTDAAARIRAANPEAEAILRFPEELLVGRRLEEVILSSSFPSLDELERTGTWTGQIEVSGLDRRGQTLHVLVLAIPQPRSDGCQILIADRSVEVLRDQELERKSKLATLGEALAGVAHELKNPLTTIKAQVELALMKGSDDRDRIEALQLVDGEASRIRALVDELLGFSSTRGGGSCADLGTLLHRLIRLQRISLDDGVHLVEEMDYGGEVCGRPRKLEQIVLNLVTNAADAIREQGGSRIVVASRLTRDGRRVEIEVADDGPGIPEELLPSIFEPFVTTKPEGEGTGLGLAICRRLARSMGGSLVARNRPEQGASFVLTVPRVQEEPEAPAPRPQVGSPTAVAG